MGWETVRDGPTDVPIERLQELRDDDIVRRAQLWATGATIHDVNGLVGLYHSATAALDRLPGMRDVYAEPVLLRHTLELVDCVRCTLEDFMRHGNYRKARIDNPLPWHPEHAAERAEREERKRKRNERT